MNTQHTIYARNTPSSPTGIYLPAIVHPRRTLGHRSFDFSHQVAVMAIVNRTPDSFPIQASLGLCKRVRELRAAT